MHTCTCHIHPNARIKAPHSQYNTTSPPPSRAQGTASSTTHGPWGDVSGMATSAYPAMIGVLLSLGHHQNDLLGWGVVLLPSNHIPANALLEAPFKHRQQH